MYIQGVLVQLLQGHKTKKHQTNIKLVALTQISKFVVHAEHFSKESKIIYHYIIWVYTYVYGGSTTKWVLPFTPTYMLIYSLIHLGLG